MANVDDEQNAWADYLCFYRFFFSSSFKSVSLTYIVIYEIYPIILDRNEHTVEDRSQ